MTVFALLLAPGVALADEKPDCANPQTQLDMTICSNEDYKAADSELNAAYKKAMASMKETDSYLPEGEKGAAKALLAAQRAWIEYRDRACESETFLVKGGSMEPMIYAECMTRITRERTAALEDLAQGMGN
ncbi:lysozyme inhibitor LprI family protein [Microbaculum marinum]|uniref:Lysozyme inhibitor LprI family protein n=1 Tax=Microbaculum marinum TaxID=1764581 RepID=A0AAW9S1A7_9HYPH